MVDVIMTNTWTGSAQYSSSCVKEAGDVHALSALTCTGERQQQQLTEGGKHACRRVMVLMDRTLPALTAAAISRWIAADKAKQQECWSFFRAVIAGTQKGSCRMPS